MNERGADQAVDWGLPPVRTSTLDTPPDLLERRAAMPTSLPEPPPGLELEECTLGGVFCVVCSPERPLATVLWFHGGGYRMGSAHHSASFGLRLCAEARVRVVVVDYPMAPEHPFPAALHAAALSYDASAARWAGSLLAGGDSAGGGLAVALTVAAGRVGRPRPEGLLLLSPWIDLTGKARTHVSRASTDGLFSSGTAREAAALYLQGWDAHDPLVSPIFAEVAGFPPTALFASVDEVLLDDARQFCERLTEAGGEVLAHFVPGMPHVWPTLLPDDPASQIVLEEIARFVAARVVGRPGARAEGPDSVA